MNQCKNLEKCIQSITWAWLAAYGGREVQAPNCKTCNAYQSEGEGGTLMEIEKLIEAIKLCGSTPSVYQCKQCAYWAGGDMSQCIPRMAADVADTLEQLQAENDRLGAELEKEEAARKKQADILYELRGQKYESTTAIDQLRAENERLRRERDAAVEEIPKVCYYCKHRKGWKTCDRFNGNSEAETCTNW